MKIFVALLLCSTAFCAAEIDEEDQTLDEIIKSNDYPDIIGDDGKLDEKKLMEETGMKEMDPKLMEEFKAFARKMFDNSGDIRNAVQGVKDPKNPDFKERKRINAAVWRELKKNRKMYKPQIKSMAKKLPSAVKDKMETKLSKTWKSIKNFFKHPMQSMKNKEESSHIIRKRFVLTTTAALIIVGVIVGLLLIWLISVVVTH